VGPLGSDAGYFTQFWWTGFVKSVATLSLPMIPEVFAGTHYPFVNGSLWTIRYEVICYLAVMLFGIFGGFRIRSAWLVATVAFTAVFMLGRFDAWPLDGKTGQHLARFFMIFGIGGCYFLYGRDALARSLGALTAGVILAIMISSPHWAELGVAVFGGYLILTFATRKATTFAWFNDLPDISYGV
jgi:peptidoglycan/LPS O-acetylase OafA/YrhL